MSDENMTIKKLIEKVYEGEVVLPDFQRSFIWEPEQVRELLVSALGDYFMGAMLILELFKDDSPFKLRLIEGVKKLNPQAEIKSIVKIILDGQQRTTALFYALYAPDLPLKGRKSAYKFYLDLEKALNGDWNNAVIGLNVKDRRRLSEIKEKELIVPFTALKDSKEIINRFKNHPHFDDIFDLIKSFLDRKIYTIKLAKDTSLEKIVETFERINRTGKPLSIFDLLTAKLYKDNINLRDLLKESKSQYSFLNLIKPESILKVIALIRNEEPKRKNILELKAENFKEDWQTAIVSLDIAYKRITDIKNGYGVFDFSKWMPYTTMLVPLAAIIDFIKTSNIESPDNYKKIDKWYWVSVFSNRYDQSVDTTSASDMKLLKEWLLDDSKIPSFITSFNPKEIDMDIEKQSSAIYRGIINLIVISGALDFKTGNPPQFDKEKVQDDHIFPKSLYKNNTIPNRTLISTNISKGNKKPSEYFKEIIDSYGRNRLIEVLKTHLISEKALDCLLENNLEGFLEERKRVFQSKIEELIGIEGFRVEYSLVKPTDPFSNKIMFGEMIRSCDTYLYWIDKYFSVEGLRLLSQFLDQEKVKEVKILMSPEKANRDFRSWFKDFKTQMNNKGVFCELRVIINPKLKSQIHDGWVISKYQGFNIPSPDTIARGQYSEIKKTKNRPPFEKWWEESLDIITDWEKIERLKNNNG